MVRNLLVGITLTYPAIFRGLTFGTMVVDNGWYLQAQLLMYFALLGMTKVNRRIQPALITGRVLLYIVLCFVMGLNSLWYECVWCFPLGVFYSQQRDKIVSLFSDFRRFLLLDGGVSCLFCMTTLYAFRPLLDSAMIALIAKLFSSIFAAILWGWLAILWKVRIICISWVGTHSLEVYALQGIWLGLFKNYSPALYCLMVLGCTFVSAALLHSVTKAIRKHIEMRIGGE